jgi:hypothetical protein
VTDAAGNVYVAGDASEALPGNTFAGFYDRFLVKFDSAGTQLWSREFGTVAGDWVTGLAIDGAGNLYVAGYTDDSTGMLTTPDIGHAFLAKYDGAGTALWTRTIASTGYERSTGVATDGSGNIYVVGGTTGDFDGSGNAGGEADAYVVKYDGAGNRIWGRQLGTAKRDEAGAVAADTAGNVYVVGGTYGGFDTPATGGRSVAFVAKYDTAGTRAWVRQTPASAERASAVAVDPRGDVFIAGVCYGALDGQPGIGGDGDVFVMKFSTDGTKY